MYNAPMAISEIKILLRALHSRNFRLFVAGQSISLIGTWMQSVAMSWLVYRLHSGAAGKYLSIRFQVSLHRSEFLRLNYKRERHPRH